MYVAKPYLLVVYLSIYSLCICPGSCVIFVLFTQGGPKPSTLEQASPLFLLLENLYRRELSLFLILPNTSWASGTMRKMKAAREKSNNTMLHCTDPVPLNLSLHFKLQYTEVVHCIVTSKVGQPRIGSDIDVSWETCLLLYCSVGRLGPAEMDTSRSGALLLLLVPVQCDVPERLLL